MDRIRSVFGSLLRRKSFVFKKQDAEKESRKQDKVWNELVKPTIEIFQGSDFKNWWSVRFCKEEVDIADADELAELETEDDHDPTFGRYPTSWTPEDKLQECIKYSSQIDDLKAKIEDIFSLGKQGSPYDRKTSDKMHKQLSELSIKLVNSQEQIYEAFMTRYPRFHRLRVEPSLMALYYYAEQNPCLYRQGGVIADGIRAHLWEIMSRCCLYRQQLNHRLGSRTPGANKSQYYQSLLARIPSDRSTGTSPKQKLVYDQIAKDINRTLADETYFTSSKNCDKLRNILEAFSLHHPKIGYCQSMNFVAGALLMTTDDEELAFWIFCRLVTEIMPPDYYSLTMSGVVTDVQVLTKLLKTYLPAVESLLAKLEVKLEILCCHMLMSLCFGAAPLPVARRCMDLVLAEGSHVLVCIVLAMIVVCKEQILAQEDAGDMMLLLAGIGKDLHPEVQEEFFSCVYHYIELCGGTILGLRSQLAEDVRAAQEKLLAKCFINESPDSLEDPTLTESTSDGGARRVSDTSLPPAPKRSGSHDSAGSARSFTFGDQKAQAARSDAKKKVVSRSKEGPHSTPATSMGDSEKESLAWMQKVKRIPFQNVQMLVGMGFPLPVVQRACVETMGQPLSATIDWLLHNHLKEAKSAVEVEEMKQKAKESEASTTGGTGGGARNKKSRKRQMLRVSVPAGVVPGQMIQVRTPYGRLLRVRVPRGHGPGSQFLLECSTPRSKREKKTNGGDSHSGKTGSRGHRNTARTSSIPDLSQAAKQAASGAGGENKRFLRFTVPKGVKPGDVVSISTPEGNKMKLALPKGAYPGKQLRVEYTLQKSRTRTKNKTRKRGGHKDSHGSLGSSSASGGSFDTSRHSSGQQHRSLAGLPKGWTKKKISCAGKPFGMNIQEGTVIVTRVKGEAKRAGVSPGDRVVSMGGMAVDPKTWKAVYEAATPPFPIVLLTPTGNSSSSPNAKLDSSSQNNPFVTGDNNDSLKRRYITVCVSPFGMTCKGGDREGVIVKHVEGEAALCGVQVGDRLEKIGGKFVEISTWKEMFRAAFKRLPFDIVLVAVDKQPKTNVSSNRSPKHHHRRQRSSSGRKVEIKFDAKKPIGIELRETSAGLLILRTEPNTQASGRVGVGWRLVSIAGKRVTTRQDVGAAMRQHRSQDAPSAPVVMLFYVKGRGGSKSPRSRKNSNGKRGSVSPTSRHRKSGGKHAAKSPRQRKKSPGGRRNRSKSPGKSPGKRGSASTLPSRSSKERASASRSSSSTAAAAAAAGAEASSGGAASGPAKKEDKSQGQGQRDQFQNQWGKELGQMADMGLKDTRKNVEALERAKGKVEVAVQLVLNGSSSNNNGGANSYVASSSESSIAPTSNKLDKRRQLTVQEKLAQIRGMGFSDDAKSASALESANGDVETACAMLLSEQKNK